MKYLRNLHKIGILFLKNRDMCKSMLLRFKAVCLIFIFWLTFQGLPVSGDRECEISLQDRPVIYQIFSQWKEDLTNRFIISFNNIFVIGEGSFNYVHDWDPLFTYKGETAYSFNTRYYDLLVQFLQPLLSFHLKGLIVTTSLPEANNLYRFLSKKFKHIRFVVYHRMLPSARQKQLLSDSLGQKPYYIIAVREWPIGDLSHLSAYIDMDINTPITERVRDIPRLLLPYKGKQVEMLFLVNDKKDQNEMEDSLRLINISRGLPFHKKGLNPVPKGKNHQLRQKLLIARDSLKKSLTANSLTREVFDKIDRASRAFVWELEGKWMDYDSAKEFIQPFN